MKKIGVIHGRFQPFHNDHLKYVLAGMEKVDFMFIGITNPDPSLTRTVMADLNRATPAANPCTYYERLLMIEKSLQEAGIKRENFTIIPFPINIPELWQFYAPQDATYFLSIYDEWGERKLGELLKHGLKTEVLWRKKIEEKGIDGSMVRHNIANDLPWEHLVPPAVAKIIKDQGIEKRIKTTY